MYQYQPWGYQPYQIYQPAPQTQGSPLSSSQTAQLMQLIRSTTPEEAKAQVQRLIRERGITDEEWQQTARQASEICRALGIR